MTIQLPCLSVKGNVPIRMRPSGVIWLIWFCFMFPPKNKTVLPMTAVQECLRLEPKYAPASGKIVIENVRFP